MLSTRLIHAVKLHPTSQWRLAQRCGLHPSVLSRWLHGAVTPKPDDNRLHKLASIVGVEPGNCFPDQPSSHLEERPNVLASVCPVAGKQ